MLAEHEYTRGVLAGIASFIRSYRFWRVDLIQRNWGGVMDDPSGYAGIIVHSASPDMEQRLAALSIPVINISSGPEPPLVPHVCSDNKAIGRMGAEHFLELGHRNFGFFVYQDRFYCRQRRRAFERTVREAGFSVSVCDVTGAEADADNLDAWLPELPKPAAVMGMTDGAAREVARACVELGILVPEEVSILGVDNEPILCDFSPVPLSSIDQDTRELGYEAAGLLSRMMRGRKVRSGRRTIPPRCVVVRRSSDMLAIDDPLVVQAVAYIREHASDGVSVEQVADYLGTSRRWLDDRFRASLNRTAAAEIKRVRVERVKALLAESELELSRIAELTAFGNSKVLVTVFRRLTGMTPGSYRKRVRGRSG